MSSLDERLDKIEQQVDYVMASLREYRDEHRESQVLELARQINELAEASGLAQEEIDDASRIAHLLQQNADWFKKRPYRYGPAADSSSEPESSRPAEAMEAAGTGSPESAGLL